MAIRTSEATWIGTLKEGRGMMKLGRGLSIRLRRLDSSVSLPLFPDSPGL